MKLYTAPDCPYCHHVLQVVKKLGLEDNIQVKDRSNPEHLKELVRTGGKNQVPFLVDESNGVKLYESHDIIDYLKRTYGLSETDPARFTDGG